VLPSDGLPCDPPGIASLGWEGAYKVWGLWGGVADLPQRESENDGHGVVGHAVIEETARVHVGWQDVLEADQ